MLKIVDKVMPEAVILEHVDAMDDGYQDTGLDHVLQVLGDRGYDPQALSTDASAYGSYQSRKRLYIVGVLSPGRVFKIMSFATIFNQMLKLLNNFKLKAFDLIDIAFKSPPSLRNELRERVAHSQPRAWESGTIDIHRQAWPSLGLRWQACQATAGDRKSEWFQTIGARARYTLAFHQHISRPGAVKTVW